MKLFDNLSSEEKKKVTDAVIPVLERYRLLKMFDNLDEEDEAFCRNIESAVGKLPTLEGSIINARYLSVDAGSLTDRQVYSFILNPPISHITYSKSRNRAMIKLALILEIPTGITINL